MISTLGVLVAGLLPMAAALPAEETPTAPDPTGRPYVYLLGGTFTPDSNSQLGNESGKYGLAVGFGARHSRYIAWEIELFNDHQSVDTPPGYYSGFLVTTSGRADLSVIGLVPNLRLIYPIGRFEPYIGAGLGLYWVELEVSQSFLGLPVSKKKDDTTTGTQFLAGVEYVFGQKGNSVGIQYRKLNLSASLGSEVAGKVDAGGSFWFLSFRASF